MTQPLTADELRSRIAADQEALTKLEAASAEDAPPAFLDGLTATNANNTDGWEPPPRETVEDALAEVRRRNGGKLRSEVEAERIGATAGETTVGLTGASSASAADGRAEAVRRAARRR